MRRVITLRPPVFLFDQTPTIVHGVQQAKELPGRQGPKRPDADNAFGDRNAGQEFGNHRSVSVQPGVKPGNNRMPLASIKAAQIKIRWEVNYQKFYSIFQRIADCPATSLSQCDETVPETLFEPMETAAFGFSDEDDENLCRTIVMHVERSGIP